MVDIEKLAKLARIKITDKEKEKFETEFEEILNYVSSLKDLPTADFSEKDKSTTKLENVMREDVAPENPEVFADDILKQAPATKKGYVKVKHIFD